jgi:hypothetical protein
MSESYFNKRDGNFYSAIQQASAMTLLETNFDNLLIDIDIDIDISLLLELDFLCLIGNRF